MRCAAAALILCALAGACGDDAPEYLSRAEMLDPETCEGCHPVHYAQWKSSMHAYAADDPVFLAMNARGQRETNGELGDFCVGCHAPMAVREGATTDGLNLAEVPQHLKGVTCFFCHTVESVEGSHNAPLVLADDLVMRGGYADPVANPAHAAAHSPYLDGNRLESADMCGACHDLVTPAGVHLERTYLEWQESVFNKPRAQGGLTCNGCHMFSDEPGVIADVDGLDVPLRYPHEHLWPGVDVAITEWPGKAEQLAAIERDLSVAVVPRLCIQPTNGGEILYRLDNIGAGHNLPSGAGQDRRMWAHVIGYDEQGAVVFESGNVPEGVAVAEVAATDSHLWQIRDYALDENGDEVHMFWDARDYRSELLQKAVTNDPNDPAFDHSMTRSYPWGAAKPAQVVAIAYMRPIGLEVIDDLIASGDLDPGYRDEFPTFPIEQTYIWWDAVIDDGKTCVQGRSGEPPALPRD